MAWRGDKSTSFGSRATKVLTSAAQHWRTKQTSNPRSAELTAVANSSCSKQNSFTLSVRNRWGSNSLHFKFTFCWPPCLQNSAPNHKKEALSVLWWKEHLQGWCLLIKHFEWVFWGWLAETARKQKCSCERRRIEFLWIRIFSGQPVSL